MGESELQKIITCQTRCPYSIQRDDTSGGWLGLEADVTYHNCGIDWPREKSVCTSGLEKEPNVKCINGFVELPKRESGPITKKMVEYQEIEFEADFLNAEF